jgi:hypothetical protein
MIPAGDLDLVSVGFSLLGATEQQIPGIFIA